jgi:tetratricopeptide (TPR) repeat protein
LNRAALPATLGLAPQADKQPIDTMFRDRLIQLLAALAVTTAATATGAPAYAQTGDEGFTFGPPDDAVEVPEQAPRRDPRVDAAERYADCLEMARSEPDKAVERARTWQDTGGGDPARHCEAIAHMTRGDYHRAGRMLEDLARTMPQDIGEAPRVNALSQASRAWLLGERPARAEAAATQALEMQPDDVELLLDRAHARFQAGAYWETIDDLNRAIEIAPERADLYVYRGSAYRYVDAPTMARENLERALKIDSDNVEALFELGALARIQGDTAAARERWMAVIRRAPGSGLAQAARENLQQMDVRVDDPAG